MRVSLVEERETGLVDRLRKRDVELTILRLALVDTDEDLRVERLFDARHFVNEPCAANCPHPGVILCSAG
jgi:hypothetical protein